MDHSRVIQPPRNGIFTNKKIWKVYICPIAQLLQTSIFFFGYDGDALQAWPVVFLEVVPLRNVWLRCWDLRTVNTVAVSVLGGPPLRWLRCRRKVGLAWTKAFCWFFYREISENISSSWNMKNFSNGLQVPAKIYHDTVDDEKIQQAHQLRLVTGHLSLRCPFSDQQQHVCLIWSMMSIFCYKNIGGSYAIITFC